jgi:hypothetical protein
MATVVVSPAPTATDQRSDSSSYTIPAGKYAVVTLFVANGGNVSINAKVMLTSNAWSAMAANASPYTDTSSNRLLVETAGGSFPVSPAFTNSAATTAVSAQYVLIAGDVIVGNGVGQVSYSIALYNV